MRSWDYKHCLFSGISSRFKKKYNYTKLKANLRLNVLTKNRGYYWGSFTIFVETYFQLSLIFSLLTYIWYWTQVWYICYRSSYIADTLKLLYACIFLFYLHFYVQTVVGIYRSAGFLCLCCLSAHFSSWWNAKTIKKKRRF